MLRRTSPPLRVHSLVPTPHSQRSPPLRGDARTLRDPKVAARGAPCPAAPRTAAQSSSTTFAEPVLSRGSASRVDPRQAARGLARSPTLTPVPHRSPVRRPAPPAAPTSPRRSSAATRAHPRPAPLAGRSRRTLSSRPPRRTAGPPLPPFPAPPRSAGASSSSEMRFYCPRPRLSIPSPHPGARLSPAAVQRSRARRQA